MVSAVTYGRPIQGAANSGRKHWYQIIDLVDDPAEQFQLG